MTSLNELRSVARFVADVFQHEAKWRHRLPTADEVVIAAYAVATTVVDAEVRNCFAFLGAPGHVRCALADVSAGAARVSRQLSDTALSVVRYLDQGGDNLTARTQESIDADRRILALAARDYHRTGNVNHSAIARKVDLSHTSVRDRLSSRAARTMLRLHVDAPTIWSAKGRPIAEPLGTSKVWKADCGDLALAA